MANKAYILDFSIAQDRELEKTLFSLLPDYKAARLGQDAHEKAYCQAIYSHGLLLYAFKLLGCDVNKMLFFGGNGKKPYQIGAQGLFFSISHSDNLVSCVVGNGEVGIDTEKIVPRDNLSALARRIMGKGSAAYSCFEGLSGDARLNYFYEHFTLMESAVKLRGDGLFNGIGGGEEYLLGASYKHFYELDAVTCVCGTEVSALQIVSAHELSAIFK